MQTNDLDYWKNPLVVKEQWKHLRLYDPTNSEDITVWFTTDAIKITGVSSWLSGEINSLTWALWHGVGREGDGERIAGMNTTAKTGTDHILLESRLNSLYIPANSWIWLTTTAIGVPWVAPAVRLKSMWDRLKKCVRILLGSEEAEPETERAFYLKISYEKIE